MYSYANHPNRKTLDTIAKANRKFEAAKQFHAETYSREKLKKLNLLLHKTSLLYNYFLNI